MHNKEISSSQTSPQNKGEEGESRKRRGEAREEGGQRKTKERDAQGGKRKRSPRGKREARDGGRGGGEGQRLLRQAEGEERFHLVDLSHK